MMMTAGQYTANDHQARLKTSFQMSVVSLFVGSLLLLLQLMLSAHLLPDKIDDLT